MKNTILIILFSFFSNLVFSQDLIAPNMDTLAMNNASISMVYYDLLLHKERPYPPQDQSKNTVIILNEEKIISFEELTKIDPKTVLSIKELKNNDTAIRIVRVVLLRVKK